MHLQVWHYKQLTVDICCTCPLHHKYNLVYIHCTWCSVTCSIQFQRVLPEWIPQCDGTHSEGQIVNKDIVSVESLVLPYFRLHAKLNLVSCSQPLFRNNRRGKQGRWHIGAKKALSNLHPTHMYQFLLQWLKTRLMANKAMRNAVDKVCWKTKTPKDSENM